MNVQTFDAGDALDLENALIALERLGAAGGQLGESARRASGAVLSVVAVMTPVEVEVEWIDDDRERGEAAE